MRTFLRTTTRRASRLTKSVAGSVRLLPRYLAFRFLGLGDSHRLSQFLVPRVLIKREFGMTSVQEQAYFEWYAAHIYRGRGAIVDLGSWLGSTTIPLARGLARNSVARKRGAIHAFDLFVWDDRMYDAVVGTPFESAFREGESFADVFRMQVAPFGHDVQVHEGDLATVAWNDGEIELLLVDAMKSWTLAQNIVREFYTALVEGSYLLQQDFAHWYTPWIHLIGYRFRDYFEVAYDIPWSTSLVFRLSRALPTELSQLSLDKAAFGSSEIEQAFDYSLSLIGRDKWPQVLSAKAKALFESGDSAEAQRALASAEAAGEDPNVVSVKEFMAAGTSG